MDKITNNLPKYFNFPGPWLGGISLIVSPLLLFLGDLLKINFHYYYPDQLVAYANHPTLIISSYNLFTIGFILMWPAILLLTQLIGVKRPNWGKFGGTLAMIGILIWLFHEGINYMAFKLVDVQGPDAAIQAVADSYSTWYILYPLVFTDNLGWLVLAIGAYLSRTLGLFRSLALASMAIHYSGVLKGSDWVQVLLTFGLCISFVPLGIKILMNATKPSKQAILSTVAIIIAITFLYMYTL